MNIIYVFAGGALGALIRYLILLLFKPYPLNVIGVFAVNVIGCFILGFIAYIAIKKYNLLSDNMNKFLSVGFAGGFTTFSAFSHPAIEMFLKHHYMYAFLNMFLSVIIGLIFVSWGMNCGYSLLNYMIRSKKLKLRQEY